MNKGKVIDIQKKYAIVLNDQMVYEKIEKKTGMSLGKEIYYFEEDKYKEAKQPVKKYLLVAAVLFMMLFIQPLLVAEETYGYISVDINPSIELQVNKSLEVLSIEAINDDAKAIIKDEWIGKFAKDVINLIIEETRSKGILNNERDFVLVSYYFNDQDPTSEEVFIQSLDELFNEKPHDYEVAVVKSDEETYSEAKESKESLGHQVVSKKMNQPVDDLLAAKESIEQDGDFKVYKKDTDNKSEVEQKDKESSGVLGRKSAEAIAFEVIGGEGKILDFDFDREQDEAEYTFEIALDDKIHEITINGLTGAIIKHEIDLNNKRDEDNENTNEESQPSKGVIGRKTAETIAFEKIGVAGKILEFDFERDDDEAEYEFEIAADNKIYEIKIDGFTGEVIKYEVDIDDDSDDEKSQSVRGVIGRKEAESIVFEIIGGEGRILEFEFDLDDGEAEYEFEVELEGKIHEIKIDGFTGEIIKYEVDIDDDDDSDDEKSQSVRGVIGRKAAESIVFETIGNKGKIIEYEFDRDDGESEYEFEVELNGKIHEIKIDGFTGEVLEHIVDEQDTDEDKSDEKNNENSSETIIGRKTAESIVFDTIGGEGKITEYDFDRDDDEAEYEFEVEFDRKIHEIKIDGFTGEVIEYEVEEGDEDDSDENKRNRLSKDIIDRETAESIVFETIGGEGEIIDFEFDRDDDEAEYSFEVELKGKIHEIKVDGFTGEIIEHEVD